MSLADYFERTKGIGVLATADAQGNVDIALYARPHVMNDDEFVFIMADHLSHDNVVANPHAAYLFLEREEGDRRDAGSAYNGMRLYLTRTKEETDPQRIAEIRRKSRRGRQSTDLPKFLVHFKVDRTRPVVGD